jgi:uncharacterized protein YidB (DUF937 family)
MNGFSNAMKKKMMIGSLSAAMVLSIGATGTIHTAWAAESVQEQTVQAAAAAAVSLVDARIISVVEDAAYVSWKNADEIRLALQDGKSILAASGLNEMDLLGRLARLAYQDIDAAVAGGKLKTEEADALRSEAAVKLHKVIAVEGYERKSPDYFIEKLDRTIIADTSFVSGVEQADIQESLWYGNHLAEASGLGQEVLAEKLMQNINKEIDSALARLELTADEAKAAKEQAAAQLKETIMKKGFEKPKYWADTDAIIQARINTVIEDTASVLEMDAYYLELALKEGRNLSGATGLSVEDLLSKLSDKVNSDLYAAYNRGELKAETVETAKADAAEQLRKVILTYGYEKTQAPADYSGILQSRMKSIFEDAAAAAGVDAYDIKSSVGRGASLAEASGFTEQELLDKLSALAATDLETARSNGKLTAAEAEQALSEAVKVLKETVGLKGYKNDRERSDYSYVVYDRLNSMVKDIAASADRDAAELEYARNQGQTLAQASGLSYDELQKRLSWLLSVDVDNLQSYGKVSSDEAAKLKTQGDEAISKALEMK